MHASRLAPQRHDRAPDSAAATHGTGRQDTLLLLLPVKRASDIVFGARYAKRLQEWGICVSVSLLHVTPAQARPAAGLPQQDAAEDAGSTLTPAAEQIMHEAGLYLSRSHIAFTTHIFSGEIIFTILDTAEMLGCHEIVLPAIKNSSWRSRFSDALARKLARASRSATVLLANTDGMSCPPLP